MLIKEKVEKTYTQIRVRIDIATSKKLEKIRLKTGKSFQEIVKRLIEKEYKELTNDES